MAWAGVALGFDQDANACCSMNLPPKKDAYSKIRLVSCTSPLFLFSDRLGAAERPVACVRVASSWFLVKVAEASRSAWVVGSWLGTVAAGLAVTRRLPFLSPYLQLCSSIGSQARRDRRLVRPYRQTIWSEKSCHATPPRMASGRGRR